MPKLGEELSKPGPTHLPAALLVKRPGVSCPKYLNPLDPDGLQAGTAAITTYSRVTKLSWVNI